MRHPLLHFMTGKLYAILQCYNTNHGVSLILIPYSSSKFNSSNLRDALIIRISRGNRPLSCCHLKGWIQLRYSILTRLAFELRKKISLEVLPISQIRKQDVGSHTSLYAGHTRSSYTSSFLTQFRRGQFSNSKQYSEA